MPSPFVVLAAADAASPDLEFEGVVGFSGEGAGSAAWAPGSDLLAYAADCLVVVEDLKTRKCRYSSPYNTETGFCCSSVGSSSSAVRPHQLGRAQEGWLRLQGGRLHS